MGWPAGYHVLMVPVLDAATMASALTRLGELAAAEGRSLELTVVGGASMLLGFGARRSTRDVDYVSSNVPDDVLSPLARVVAAERGWPDDWLNGNARHFVRSASVGPVLLERPGLVIRSVSLPHLLATKLLALRDDVDRQDAVALIRRIGASRDAVELALSPYVPPDRLVEVGYELQDLFEELDDDPAR